MLKRFFNFLKVKINNFFTFLRHWSEFITLPLALLLWWHSKNILILIDPTAGVHDAGVLQVFLLATAGLLFVHAFVWIILLIAAKDVYDTLDDYLTKHKGDITKWEKAKFSLWYFCALLFAWVLLVMGLN